MIVDYLTLTFAEEHEANFLTLGRKIDPGAVALESKSGYVEDWNF